VVALCMFRQSPLFFGETTTVQISSTQFTIW
jgi:hypothetical protein